jgi:hypothetical protein
MIAAVAGLDAKEMGHRRTSMTGGLIVIADSDFGYFTKSEWADRRAVHGGRLRHSPVCAQAHHNDNSSHVFLYNPSR